MPIILTPEIPCPPPTPPSGDLSPERPVIKAAVSQVDGCPILTRLKAFVMQQGVPGTLQHTLRSDNGKPIDLTAIFTDPVTGFATGATVLLNVKEVLASGFNPVINPLWRLSGSVSTPATGLIEADIPRSVVKHAGIYELAWGIKDGSDNVILANSALMSVERSLFADNELTTLAGLGPPTLREIRLSIKDSAPAENQLLRDVEFATEEILDAIRRPIDYWNEVPPPIARFTTRNFPYKEHWRKAIAGYLFAMAADNYRRNHLSYQGAGLTVDDKNKEREYIAASERLIQEYQAWTFTQKIQLNVRSFVGHVGSAYGYGVRG